MPSAQDPFFLILFFVLGLMVGSFLNVCIYRLPRHLSVAKPKRSFCPSCEKKIAWHDNIPLLSFMLLRGRCRHCGAEIPSRYFVTELLCGLMWMGLWRFFGPTSFFAVGLVFFSILLAIIFTDFETGLIPDTLSLTGLALGLIFSTIFPELQKEALWYRGLLYSFYGALGGGGFLYIMALVGDFVFKKESMGGGDIKLLAMIGAFLGIKQVIFVFFLAPVLALPFGLYIKFRKKEETIPYGPFLAVTAAMFYLMGDKIIAYFLI